MAELKFGKWSFSEEELEKQLALAKKRGEEEDKATPKAIASHFDRASNRFFVDFANGSVFGFPVPLIEELSNAPKESIERGKLTASGDALHWEDLNAHYTIAGLLTGIFGTRAWMRELGKRGGAAVSDAKREAARRNGAKGGRPKQNISESVNELTCDVSGNAAFSSGASKIVSPVLKAPSPTRVAQLDRLFTNLTDPIAHSQRTSLTISPVTSRNRVVALALEE